MTQIFRPEHSTKQIHWLHITILFIVGISIIGLSYAILYTNLLKIKDFEIENARLVTIDQIITALTIENIKNNNWRHWFGADNLLFWIGQTTTIAPEEIPLLANLEIKINFPKKEITLLVEERKLTGVWCFEEDKCFGFDQQGIIFAEVPNIEGNLILKIEDQNNLSLQLGQQIFKKSNWIENILAVATTLQENKIAFSLIKIRALELQEWEVILPSNLVIYLDLNSIPEDLGKILKRLDQELALSELSYIDFRVPNRIYYK